MKFITTILFIFLFVPSMFSQVKEKKNKKQKHIIELRRDSAYQNILAEGHSLFQVQKYHEAIDKYKEALDIIPEDSYAKAKIEDIKLIIDSLTEMVIAENEAEEKIKELKEKEKEEPIKVIEPIKAIDTIKLTEKKVEKEVTTEDETPVKITQKEPIKTITKETPKTEIKEGVAKKGSPEHRALLGNEYKNGVTEKTFMEGKKQIIERIVVINGKGDEYRQVIHPWGGKYFFKNGKSITERAWKAETVLKD